MSVTYPEFGEAEKHAAIAATRFGFGLRPGELAIIAAGPQKWLTDQLDYADTPPEIKNLPNGPHHMKRVLEAGAGKKSTYRGFIHEAIQSGQYEAAQTALAVYNSPNPFVERLVKFWSGHFTLSAAKLPHMAPLVAAFERDAIRPYVLGPFYKMLLAVIKHPAMLAIWGNDGSIGPMSDVGWDGHYRLDQTLAREIMGRYTMGPQGKFFQGDVQSLAAMLSGWTIGSLRSNNPGGFVYRDDWHQINKKRFLHRIMPEGGILEGEAALELLTHQESTGWHLARRMAEYFIGDAPPEGLVTDLVNGYADSGGDLRSMALALINSGYAWEDRQQKLKTPEDLVYSTFKALDVPLADGRPLVRAMQMLGQPMLKSPPREGWPTDATFWAGPDLLADRVDWVVGMARANGVQLTPPVHGIHVLGPLLTPRTFRSLTVARNNATGIAILLSSSEFQRR
ncbi:DUF1800 domain-containing protein [Aestuariispira ectoiniformans]|uniref:DUF1800 domain-containing protein n=1 Tax=Aestuariispira ectoiniformans TaxID=2775080 RepID=UPI00223C3746|nr:DUF1800 domain-containing protein [Aestuariispira ectoiniformans]